MKSRDPVQKHCQDCGAIFECGIGRDTPCWCAREFLPVMPVPDAAGDCYCANCLSAHIALTDTGKSN